MPAPPQMPPVASSLGLATGQLTSIVFWLAAAACTTMTGPLRAATADDLLGALRERDGPAALSALASLDRPLGAAEQAAVGRMLEGLSLQSGLGPAVDRLRADYPESAAIQFGAAQVYANSNEIDTALEICQQAIERGPTLEWLLHRAAVLAYTKNRYPEAELWASRLLGLRPRHADARFLIGCVESRTGRTESARASLLAIAAADPEHRLVFYELGLLENQAGNSAAAARYLRAAIRTQPFMAEAYNNLLIALSRSGMDDEVRALEPIARHLAGWRSAKRERIWALLQEPDSISSEQAHELALEYCLVRREDLAKAYIERRLASGPADDRLVLLLAQIAYNQGDSRRCLDHLERVAGQQARGSEPYLALRGWALLAVGSAEESRTVWEAARQRFPDSTRLIALGQALAAPAATPSPDAPATDVAAAPQASPDPAAAAPGAAGEVVAVAPAGPVIAAAEPLTAAASEAGFRFADVADSRGLGGFRHIFGPPDKPWIVHAMGSGVAVADYDRDGWDDLYFVNGRPEIDRPDPRWRNALFRNVGGRFVDVTEQAGVGDLGYGMCALFGDVDRDGWLDLYVGNLGPNVLYRNRGDGTFTDITARAGAGDAGHAAAAAFGDIDRDGWLDLFVGNYVAFDPAVHGHLRATLYGMSVFPHPLRYPAQADVLYRNRGDGTFTDVSAAAGMNPSLGRAMGCAFFDLDNDRDLDLYVANDTSYNFVFENRGDGTFEDISYLSGGAFTEAGIEGASMGVSPGDYNNDGLLDLFITSYSWQTDCVFHNNGERYLIDRTGPLGLGKPSFHLVTWAGLWADFDADGWLDLFTANGHLYPQVNEVDMGLEYNQGVSFYRNLAGRQFADVTPATAIDSFTPQSSRGAALIDFDRDGDLDVAVNCIDGRPHLLENRTPQGNWLTVILEGPSACTYNVRVTARSGDRIWTRITDGGSGYLGQSTRELHFGFGAVESIDDVTVHWLHADPQVVPVGGLNRVLAVEAPAQS